MSRLAIQKILLRVQKRDRLSSAILKESVLLCLRQIEQKKQDWRINWFEIKTPCLLLILQELDGISGRLLRWLVDGADDGPDAERHVRKNFVSAVKKSEPLPSGRAPEQQEVVDDVGVLEHNVVDVSVSLKS